MSDAEKLADYERIVEIIRAQMALEQHQQKLPDATFEVRQSGRLQADRSTRNRGRYTAAQYACAARLFDTLGHGFRILTN